MEDFLVEIFLSTNEDKNKILIDIINIIELVKVDCKENSGLKLLDGESIAGFDKTCIYETCCLFVCLQWIPLLVNRFLLLFFGIMSGPWY